MAEATSTSAVATDDARAAAPLRLCEAGLRRNGLDLLMDVCLTFDRSGLTMVLGPNGAGKTLLLKLCHGLETPTSGEVIWTRADHLTDPRAQCMVFQRPIILRRSVAANIEYALRVCGLPRAERRRRLHTALELAGLSGMADRSARVLSGGEQQRLALARAWSVRPEVLFLDEPTAHLDPGATRTIEQMIASIRDQGAKIIMTTHDLGQARRLAHDIVFLNRGRVLEHTAAGVFFDRPGSAEAQAFLEGRLLW